MAQAIVDGARGVVGKRRPIHGLQREALEAKPGESFGRRIGLRVDELHLVPGADAQLGAGLRAHADPVEARRRLDGAVGLDRDREAARMQRFEQRRVDLQQRLAPGDHHVTVSAPAGPLRLDRIGKRRGGRVGAAARAIGADEIGVAEAALGTCPVGLAAGPEIAAGEAAEHRGAPGLRALALQREKDFLNGVSHAEPPFTAVSGQKRRPPQASAAPAGKAPVCRSASPSAMAAATATFSERSRGRIGIASLAPAAACTASGTPADSRPNSRTSSRWNA
jgi:hypothetical protein